MPQLLAVDMLKLLKYIKKKIYTNFENFKIFACTLSSILAIIV